MTLRGIRRRSASDPSSFMEDKSGLRWRSTREARVDRFQGCFDTIEATRPDHIDGLGVSEIRARPMQPAAGSRRRLPGQSQASVKRGERMQPVTTILARIRLTSCPSHQCSTINSEGLSQLVVVEAQIGLQASNRRSEADVDRLQSVVRRLVRTNTGRDENHFSLQSSQATPPNALCMLSRSYAHSMVRKSVGQEGESRPVGSI
jgi:hypothetical protein